MTVSYQYDVASTSSGGFIRLLFRWKGSVWKLVYYELSLLAVAYGILSLLYRFAMNEDQRLIFEHIVFYCSKFMDKIPLSFLLGFYVSFTATRWWNQYMAIPWPDRVMNVVSMYVPGTDEKSRMLRRALMRYLNLTLILVLRSISKAVKRRFPTKEHLIEAGFMTKLEMDIWSSIPSNEFNTFWVPCTWFINLLREARMDCRVTDSYGVKLIMEEFNDFRAKCGLLWSYDWISIPLVYTQVVTMATYSFFVAAIFGRQFIHSKDPIISKELSFDFYVPLFTVVQYFLYMGLLKVAEQLINPFGDDDEDFELNWIIDRHIKVCYLGVDTLCGPPPPLVKDSYFSMSDYKLPYTAASVAYKKKTYRGSAAWMHVPQKEQSMVVPEVSEEEEEAQSSSDESAPHKSSTWTLLKGAHRASMAIGSMESGTMGDSSLQLYFKSTTPVPGDSDTQISPLADPTGTKPQGSFMLTVPSDDSTSPQEPSATVLATPKKKGIFGKKGIKVQAWRGAEADYDPPQKPPKTKKHAPRTKVTFVDEGSRPNVPRRLSVPIIRNIYASQPDLGNSHQRLKDRLTAATAFARKAEMPRYALEKLLAAPFRKGSLETESMEIPQMKREDWLHHTSMPNLNLDDYPACMRKDQKPKEVVIEVPEVDIVPPSEVPTPDRDSSPEAEYVMRFLKKGSEKKVIVLPKHRAPSVESLITPKRYPLFRKRSTSLDSYTPPPSPEVPSLTIDLRPKSDVMSITPSPSPEPERVELPTEPPRQPPQVTQQVTPQGHPRDDSPPPPLPPKPKHAIPSTSGTKPKTKKSPPKFRRQVKVAEPTVPLESYLTETPGSSKYRRRGSSQPPGVIKPPPLPFCAEMPKLRPVQHDDKDDEKDSPPKEEGELSMLSPQTEHLVRPSMLRRLSKDPKTKKKKES